MTKQEYIAKQKAMERRQNKRMFLWLMLFMVGLVACICISDHPEKLEESMRLTMFLSEGLVAVALVGVSLGVWLALRHQRREGLLCRHCGKLIINSQLAVATGNCGYCGEKLFDEITEN